jgi:hypothetical protein
MADLTYKDWGRIYAYVLLQDRIGNSSYKDELERNPVQGLKKTVEALNKEYPDPGLKIEYNPDADAIWDIELPTGLWPDEFDDKKKLNNLKAYRKGNNGNKRAMLLPRLTC